MTLANFLNNNQEARKVFGKRELEIIQKQLKGFQLTQSESNRLSRDIKQKLQFIKELSGFEDEFDLVKNQENKILIKKAVNTILNHKLKDNINAILLFGSFADNNFTFRSDIDVCVIFKRELSLKEATQFRIEILGSLSDKMDIQVFNILPQKIKKSIAQNHKILYKTNKFNNLDFSIKYIKDNDFQIRMKKTGLKWAG